MITNKIVPVILCGGNGKRLWPLSTSCLPKQFIKLPGESHSLLQRTVVMVNKKYFTNPIIVTQERFHKVAKEQCAAVGLCSPGFILEENSKGTTIGSILSSLYIKKYFGDSSTVQMVLSVDNYIQNNDKFIGNVHALKNFAERQIIVFGAKVRSAETDYGYIKKGKPISKDLYGVDKFIEKPNSELANNLMQQRDYFWNSGNFMFSVKSLIKEMKKNRPKEYLKIEKSFEEGIGDRNALIPKSEYLDGMQLNSIDYEVIEKSDNLAVYQFPIPWCEHGSIHSIWKNKVPNNPDANYINGKVDAINSRNNYIATSDLPITAVGISDMIVINTGKDILIANAHSKKSFAKLISQKFNNTKFKKPWGYYLELNSGPEFKVKKLVLKPSERTSLQSHLHRSENISVITGKAEITIKDKIKHLTVGDSVQIPPKTIHRIKNCCTSSELVIVEVQIGKNIREDDITRFEDDYGRVF